MIGDVSGETFRTFQVRLAEGPTRVVLALYERNLTWADLRDRHDATSADMNLLCRLDFITSTFGGAEAAAIWKLTETGRAAVKETPDSPSESIADTCCGKCPGDTCYVDQVTGA